MTLKEFTSGERLTAQDLNDNFGGVKVHEVYTGIDLDLSANTSESSASYEFTSITSEELGGASYIKIDYKLDSSVWQDENVNGYTALKIESKDIGGAYSDTLSKTFLHYMSTTNTGTARKNNRNLVSFSWLHVLTNDEKLNGVQFQLTSYAKAGTSNNTIGTVKQVVLSGAY